jgi:hypothetical protein
MEHHVGRLIDHVHLVVADLDGNNIEVVHHGPVQRSAPSVVLETNE